MKYILIILFIFLFSCYSIPLNVINNFTQKYEGGITNNNEKIKCNGYYFSYHKFNDTIVESQPIIFFADKSVIYNFSIFHLNDLKYIQNFSSCGTYYIKDSLIKVQLIHNDFYFSYFLEFEFIILNDSTLWLNYTRGENHLKQNYMFFNDSTKSDYLTEFKFIKLNSKPDSSFWLKNKKWFWCDKQKFKEYKRNKRLNYK